MLYTLLDINDIALRVENNSTQLKSASYAVINGDEIAFGNTALQLHRLYPSQSHNNYWSQFNQNPIKCSSEHIRHNADLAFMHLSDIKQNFPNIENWLVSVPSHFGSNELSLLLGLLDAAKFKNIKFIDTSLLASSGFSINEEHTYVDVQLHQTVLTTLRADNDISIITHKIIKDISLINIEKSIEKVISDELIEQARFDTKHNAETEQLLYNKLFYVIKGLEENSSYTLEIEYKGHVHQALINRSSIQEILEPIYASINEKIETPSAIISHFLSTLTGCKQYFNNAFFVKENSLFKTASHLEDIIKNTQDSFNYINSLPKPKSSAGGTLVADSRGKVEITHSLTNNHALRINDTRLYYDNLHRPNISLSNNSIYSIYLSDNQYWIKKESDKQLYVNNSLVNNDTLLNLGDEIKIDGMPNTSRLISVD